MLWNVDTLSCKPSALENLDKMKRLYHLKVLDINSKNEYYLSTAAFIMYNLGKTDEAKSYYEKALQLNPNLTSIFSEKELTIFNKVMKNNNTK